jgi:uncharacterized protein (TIGR03118 family)
MYPRFSGKFALTLVLLVAASTSGWSQYQQVNLVSTKGISVPHKDPNLVNGWGMAYFSGSPFWVSDNLTGVSTLYDQFGNITPLVVTIPPAPSQPFGPIGTPTGIIANSTPDFVISKNDVSGPAFFLFDTEDGTISGWNPTVDPTNAVIAVDNSASAALYTGLAFAKTKTQTLLYAADAVNNKIDVYDGGFRFVKSFTDPSPPAGLSVYQVQNLNGQIYVTLATPVPLQGGAIDVFDTSGNLLQRLTTNGTSGPLEGPWGMVIAPKNFGPLSNTLLVGNVDDGHINAFNPRTGAFEGTMMDQHGNPIAIGGLWALVFGAANSVNGNTNQLFFAAGPDNYARGLFGKIMPPK